MDATLAPEFPPSLEWLNLSTPLRMAQLRGKVCALAFVNAGSAWSLQRLNDLAHLRARHGPRLNVVAVSVPKFDHERDPRRITKRVNRQELKFPVAHDAGWTLWQHYGIEAWPTVVLIDSEGHIRERIVGDGPIRELAEKVEALMADTKPSSVSADPINVRRNSEPSLPLRFPMGLALGANRLFVVDSGHHRVLECTLNGRVVRQFGSGGAGFIDGPMETAAFNRPHGLCVARDILYVADAGNHAVRRIMLRTGDVQTLCGAGRAGDTQVGVVEDPRLVEFDQPRAVALSGEILLVATAGNNRLWRFDLGENRISLLAGSGALAAVDGIGRAAAFAEPVALACVQQVVYVADAAASAIRNVRLGTKHVSTIVGQDVWTFGKVDGERDVALLQQPLALALDPDAPLLWIADAGNDALRTLRLGGGELSTYELPQRLHGPCGLAVGDGVVWIADTDAHAVLRLDIASGTLTHVPIGE